MRRSTELNHYPSVNIEQHLMSSSRDAIGQYLGELIGRHDELSAVADSSDTETLQDMRRIRTKIKLAQFSLLQSDLSPSV